MNKHRFVMALGGALGKWAGRLIVGTALAFFCTLIFKEVQAAWFIIGFIFGDIFGTTKEPVNEMIESIMKEAEKEEN
jgi:hypothetical protein